MAIVRRQRRNSWKDRKQILLGILLCVVVIGAVITTTILMNQRKEKIEVQEASISNAKGLPKIVENAPEFDVQLLTPNKYSRPQYETTGINGIVIHYTANPGTTAQQNRDYFEGLKDTGETKASSHFVIGIEGEIIQCIPSKEISYASNERNFDTISIEVCHPDKSGKFSKKTYDSLVELNAWLCGRFQISPVDIIRHYDVSGKKCPLYYVAHEDDWEDFKDDVSNYIDTYGTTPKISSQK
jgi:N-acetylmuramoyl-L-alanine amidase CwlA